MKYFKGFAGFQKIVLLWVPMNLVKGQKANEKFNYSLRGQNGIWVKFVAWTFITKLFIEIPPCV
jgi:hypothetical protein